MVCVILYWSHFHEVVHDVSRTKYKNNTGKPVKKMHAKHKFKRTLFLPAYEFSRQDYSKPIFSTQHKVLRHLTTKHTNEFGNSYIYISNLSKKRQFHQLFLSFWVQSSASDLWIFIKTGSSDMILVLLLKQLKFDWSFLGKKWKFKLRHTVCEYL